ncbi:endonuclease iv endodeoxyribonuclease iv [Anaeramoeba flamelloides]|uniref:Endonuclease iv endodeoxyribonuclease iv n=1 Tax=Anaeramoeba flamelloides TaxID=1746091 RepID=A0ABQ8XXN1_9EUKA|nr:endonuclease iv endodeoxyribonuclease iv [Anaeramoeba flamelloides]
MELENENTPDFFSLGQMENFTLEDNFLDLDFDIDFELNLQFELFTNTNLEESTTNEIQQILNKKITTPQTANQHSQDNNSEQPLSNDDYFEINLEYVSNLDLLDPESNEELNPDELKHLNELSISSECLEFDELHDSAELNDLFSLMEKFEPFEPKGTNDNSCVNGQKCLPENLILTPTKQPTITATKTMQSEEPNPNKNKNQTQTQKETTQEQQQTQEQQTTQEQTTIKEQTTVKEQKITVEQTTTKRQSNRRKRIKEKCKLKKVNSITVESGKELFKCMTGFLWVISHGSSIKQLKPFTNELAHKLTTTLSASQEETNIFSNQLKNLLSNSRRTFSEYIMEIMVGVLSLKYKKSTPKIATKYEKLLEELSKIENLNAIPLQEQESFKKKLEKIYNQIFNEKLLNYWFEKRFTDRPEHLYTKEIKTLFFEKYLYFFGKAKFQILSLVLSKELSACQKIIKNYSNLIELDYNQDVFNCYCNNRGKKLKLIKGIINRFGLNSSKYWIPMANQSIDDFPFETHSMFDIFPFKGMLLDHQKKSKNPNFRDLIPAKKRNLATIEQNKDSDITLNWFLK